MQLGDSSTVPVFPRMALAGDRPSASEVFVDDLEHAFTESHASAGSIPSRVLGNAIHVRHGTRFVDSIPRIAGDELGDHSSALLLDEHCIGIKSCILRSSMLCSAFGSMF